MSNEIMPEVTRESLEAFIQKYPQFTSGLHDWMMLCASRMDLDALNHARELFTINLARAVNIIQEQAASRSEIPVGDPLIWQ